MPAAFFCESCGEPVRLKDSVCPHCGRWFSAARCPQCGFVGEPKLFGEGCPACGYLTVRESSQTRPVAQQARGGAQSPRPPLPGWFYALAAAFLLLAMGVFLVMILRGR